MRNVSIQNIPMKYNMSETNKQKLTVTVGKPVGSSVAAGSSSSGGIRTASMTWIIPLQATISAVMTFESLILTPLSKFTVTDSPLSVSTSCPFTRSVLATSEAMTWYVRISVSLSIFSGRSRLSTVPSGRAANASFVGAVVRNVLKEQAFWIICEKCAHDVLLYIDINLTIGIHIILRHVPNTVNGPSSDRVSTNPAAVTAATRVEKSGLSIAISTID